MVLGADSAYVINLTRHKLRKKRMDHLIQKLQLTDINFVEAIDKNDYLENSFEFSKKHFDDNFWDPNGWCTLGILCCALSHRKAWKQFLDSGDEIGLFLEDDVRSTPIINELDFNKIRQDLDILNEDFNFNWGVAIYGRYGIPILKGKSITSNFSRSIIHKSQYSGHAYLLNRKSAQWFYDNTQKIRYAADIRLEISPFNTITLDKSILVQRHHDYLHCKELIVENQDRYGHVFEFLHETTNECFVDGAVTIKPGKVLFSKYIPVKSVEDQILHFKDENIPGFKFTFN